MVRSTGEKRGGPLYELRFMEGYEDDIKAWGRHPQKAKKLAKIDRMVEQLSNTPKAGIGGPKSLVGNWAGYMARRIDPDHRLVYRIESGVVEVYACWGHYPPESRLPGQRKKGFVEDSELSGMLEEWVLGS